ncbi:hypothetical protein EBB07_20885 [Paenibacillaceae bacterium]|nr:hypothetical protein EBB07_20885 [Paenibacillaceae bacterium]
MDKIAKSGWLAIAVMLSVLLVTAGCSGRTGEGGGKPRTYAQDGYMGLTNSNPGLPTNPGYFNYEADTRFMKEKLSEISGIEDADFVINDPKITATLTYSEAMTEEQQRIIEAKALEVLQYNMPRYIIDVKSR